MNFAVLLPAGAVFGLDSDFAYTFLIGIIVLIVAVLVVVPVARFYLKKENSDQAASSDIPDESGEHEVKEPDDNDRILNFITVVAFIGIIAAISVMALYNIQQTKKVNNSVDEIKKKNAVEITGEDAETDLKDPTKNVPSDFSADSLFPRSLEERPNRPPDPGPPPAVSRDSIIATGPILKTEPYKVYLSDANSISSFIIRNDGNKNLEFTLTPNSDKITVSPASGTVKPAQEFPITVTATESGMIRVSSNSLSDVVEVHYNE